MLNKFFTKYILTKDQKSVIDLLDRFIFDNYSCFILKGSAGTGKTFLLKGLVRYLLSIKKSFVLAAPTGRAAKIIRDRTMVDAKTIHKTIYSKTKLKEFGNNDEESETFKFYFALNINNTPTDTIFIIDEASMISNKYSDNEFFRFGSGKLLNDLIEFVGLESPSIKRKIIFIGDDSQLPPINTNFSPALNKDYLKRHFSISVNEFELSQVIRQRQNSGILYNATKIKRDIKKGIFNQIFFNKNFADVQSLNFNNFFDKYIKVCKNKIDEQTIIIAATNSSVKDYNEMVRNYFFKGKKNICPNDRIIIVKNNYSNKILLLNGDFGTVKYVNDKLDTRFVTLKKKSDNDNLIRKKIRLDFRDIVLTVYDMESDEYVDLKCKIIENVLYSEKADLNSDEIKALYILFKELNPKLKSGTPEFIEAIKSDPYFNALRIKFGYAVTCHKAQGGEWENVFADLKSNNGYLNSNYFRWCYTAITRAKKHLFMINEPKFQLAENMEVQNIPIKDNIFFIKNEDGKEDLQKDLSISKKISIAVKSLIDFAELEKIISRQYSEHLYFSDSMQKATIIFYYNKNEIITKILPITENELTKQIMKNLSLLSNKKIIFKYRINENSNYHDDKIVFQDFPKDKPYLFEFYKKIYSKIKDKGYFIKYIRHLNYHEVYEIEKDGQIIFLDVYYNKKGIFTKLIPNKKSKVSSEELQTLLNLLKF